MITKSRITEKNALSIFENFSIDRSLPKHKTDKNENLYEGGFGNVSFSNSVTSNFFDGDVENSKSEFGGSRKKNRNWKIRILSLVEKILNITKKPQSTEGKHNPMEILLSVRGSLKEAKDYTDRLQHYDDAIKQAVKAGQKARMEQLISARDIVKNESLLLATGFKQFLSEDTAIDFAVKCQKGLRLDWIANFVRPIPINVTQRKIEADQLKIFDNYVILHYDPRVEAFKLTKEQEEAKKDPILFGVIKDVRKLYFIDDWMDDECNLTMSEVATVLGQKSGEINVDPTVE